jgi:hypothetical protein
MLLRKQGRQVCGAHHIRRFNSQCQSPSTTSGCLKHKIIAPAICNIITLSTVLRTRLLQICTPQQSPTCAHCATLPAAEAAVSIRAGINLEIWYVGQCDAVHPLNSRLGHPSRWVRQQPQPTKIRQGSSCRCVCMQLRSPTHL